MSEHYGDIQLGDTVQWLFTTVGTDGAPTVLTGSPTATAYTDGGVTQSATGVTLTADFDGVVGLNQVSVVASGANGFAAGENIEIVLDAGTVGGTTVIGYAVGSFSIENRSNLRPTTVGNNEVDVTATGAVGIDWANVEGQSTAVDLSATDFQLVDTATAVTDDVGITQAAADKVWGTTVRILTASTNFNDVAATDIVSAGAITTLSGAIVNVDLVDTLTTYTGDTPQTADHTAAIADLPTVLEFEARTIVSANYALEATLGALNDFDVTDQLTESYAADGVAPTTAQALFLIQQIVSERDVTGTVLTIKEIDGSTTAATFTLDSATVPTNQTRSS